MHEIQRPAGGFVAWKMCENTHTMDAPGCAGEASMSTEEKLTKQGETWLLNQHLRLEAGNNHSSKITLSDGNV